MAVVESRSVGGVTRQTWDDAGNGTFTEYGADGVTVVSSRAYTAAELAWRTERAATAQAKANAVALYAVATQAIVDLIAEMPTLIGYRDGVGAPTNATINANPAAYIRAAYGDLVQTRQALIAVARVVAGATSSTDVGAG